MTSNLDNGGFRETLIGKAISRSQLERALELCLGGESADSTHYGSARRWRELRYQIYEKMADIPAQRLLARDFVLEGKKRPAFVDELRKC